MSVAPQNDPELSDLLQSWRLEPRRDAGLAARVWRRLEAQPASADGLLARIDAWTRILLARPMIASAALAACAVAGILAAEIRHAGEDRNRLDRAAAAYVRTIDPIIMADIRSATEQP